MKRILFLLFALLLALLCASCDPSSKMRPCPSCGEEDELNFKCPLCGALICESCYESAEKEMAALREQVSENAYDDGHAAGYDEGYAVGQSEGFEHGTDVGYEDGYNDGYADALADNGA